MFMYNISDRNDLRNKILSADIKSLDTYMYVIDEFILNFQHLYMNVSEADSP
jgi:hypothetical protein